MHIKKTEIRNRVFQLEFDNQLELASTFLRFEEFYESPKFKGKIFTLKEFKEWYTKEKGAFTYYEDWPAFNIPSSVLKPFIEGKFDPLSKAEKELISLFKNTTGIFYIIGVVAGADSFCNHELAHALFFTQPDYKKQVLIVLIKYDTSAIKQELRGMSGYCEEVLDDELNAWILTLSDELKAKPQKELKSELEKLFLKFKSR